MVLFIHMKRLRSSVRGRVFAATVTIAAFASVVKVASLGKEMIVSRLLGTGDALDCFYIAFLLPAFIGSILGNACNEAFVPTYIDIRENEGLEAAQRTSATVLLVLLATVFALSVTLAGSERWTLPLLASGFSPVKLALTKVLFHIFLVSLCISACNALCRAVLNAHEYFSLTAIAPISIPCVTALVLIGSPREWRIYGLAVGSLAGVATELVVLSCALRLKRISVVPRWRGVDKGLQQVLKQAIPCLAAGILMGCTTLVDQSMAAMLHSGSVSALVYANKLVPVLIGIGTSSLGVAVLPALSKLSAGGDWRGLEGVVRSYTWLIFLIGIPASALLITFSEPIIRVVFQGGAFNSSTTHLVARVQSLLCLEIPFYAASVLCVSALCALKRNDVLVWGTLIAVVQNAAFNYAFMKVFGLPGIALSTSAVYMTSFVYLRLMVGRAVRDKHMLTVHAEKRTASYGLTFSAENPD